MIWKDPTAIMSQWDDSAGTIVSVELQYLSYEIRYFGKIPKRICLYVESHVELRSIPSK